MPTLAQKLPYTHPFAGGFPYRGSQRLPSDPDALTYLAAVAAADGAPVEVGVAVAVDDFFRGTKADGTFGALKAACLLCGARTLAGALVPLVGTAPTNNNFVSGDYNRKTGLLGNGVDKWLNSNRASNADPRDSQHIACHVHTAPTTAGSGTNTFAAFLASGSSTAETSVGRLSSNSADYFVRHRAAGFAFTQVAGAANTGFVGSTRSAGASFVFRTGGADTTITAASADPSSVTQTFGVYRDETNGVSYNNGRLAFYSIGEHLTLSLLDAHISALYAAIGAAI